MTPQELSRLGFASQTVDAAVSIIRREMPTLEEFLAIDAKRDNDQVAALAVVRPIFEAAKNLIKVHGRQIRDAKAALAVVSGT